jgi:hypothetical protein
MMLLICDALTVVYLRPYLIANGYPEAEVNKIVVWYDPSAVSTRNDRAADADAGYDRMAVSGDTWRRAHGFSDQDAPTPNELALRMMTEKGAMTPELTEAMLNTVAPEMMQAVKAAAQAQSVAPMTPELQQILDGGAPAETPAEPPADAPAPVETAPEGQ